MVGDRRQPRARLPRLHWLAIAGLLALASHSSVRAQVLTWAPSGTATPGGSGTWDTTGTRWTTTGTTLTAWTNSNTGTAAFGGASSGTVTLTTITAGLLRFDTAGYVLTGGTLTLGGGATLAANTAASGTTTIQSVIAGSAGLTQTGTGVILLTGANTYTGTTSINGGTLSLGAASALGSSSAIRFGGGTLQFTASNTSDVSSLVAASTSAMSFDTNGQNVTFANALAATNSGGLTKVGSGTLTVGGGNLYSGTTTVNGGVLRIGGAGSTPFGTTAAVTLGNVAGAAVDFNNFNVSLNALSGGGATGGSVVLGTGTLTIGGSNASSTYSGALNGASGQLVKAGGGIFTLSSATTATLGSVNIQQGSLLVSPAATVNVALGTISRSTGGVASLQIGTGTISLSNLNTNGIIGPWAITGSTTNLRYATASSGTAAAYTGATAVSTNVSTNLSDTTGTVNYDLSATSGTAAATFSGNTIRYTGAAGRLAPGGTSFSVNGLMNAGSSTWTIGETAVSSGGTIRSGTTQELVITTNGQQVVVNAPIADNGAGASGVTIVSQGGAVSLLGANTFTGPINVTGGNFTLGSGSFHAATTGSVTLSPGNTLTVNNNGAQTIGVITSGALTKQGTGVLSLTGTSTYAGTTTISSGTLRLTANNQLNAATGPIDFQGGTLDLNGNTLTVNRLSAAASAVVVMNPGAIITGGTYVIDAQLIGAESRVRGLFNTGTYTFRNAVFDGSDNVSFQSGGNVVFAGTSDSVVTFGANNGTSNGNNIGAGNSLTVDGPTVNFGANGITLIGNNAGSGTAANLSILSGTVNAQNTVYMNTGGASQTGDVLGSGTITIGNGALNITSGGLTMKTNGATQSSAGGSAVVNINSGGLFSTTGITTGSTGLKIINFNSGTLRAIGNLTVSSNTNFTVNIGNGGGVIDSGTGTTTFNTGLLASGSGGLTKTGNGLLVLGTANTYTGPTTVNTGTLQIGGGSTAGSIVATSTVSVANNAVLRFNRTDDYGGAFANTITGSGGILVSAGTLPLSGSSTYTGATTIDGNAVLRLQSASALPGGIGASGGLGSLVFSGSGGVLGLEAGDFSRALGSGAGQVLASSTIGFAAFGADRVVNFGGASGTVAWGTAVTGLNGQVLTLGAATATNTVDVQNSIDLGSATRTVQALNGSADVDGRLSGNISGSGGLTKIGAGTLVLSGSNTFTGTTTVSSGTLRAGSQFALQNSVVNLSNTAGAVLDVSTVNATLGGLSGGGATGGSVAIGSGTLTVGSAHTNTAFSGGFVGAAGSLVKQGAGILTYSPTVSSTLAGLAINGGRVSLSTAAGTTLNVGAITRSAGGVAYFTIGTGSIAVSNTLNNQIIGPWAFNGLGGSSAAYVTTAGGTAAAYSGATSVANFSNLTGVSGTTNFDVTTNASSAISGSFSANTIRGPVGQNGPTWNSLFMINGYMFRGNGAYTITNSTPLTIGADRDLVLITAHTNAGSIFAVDAPIVDNAGGASSVTLVSNGQSMALYGTNSFTGDINFTASAATNLTLGKGTAHATTTANVNTSPGTNLIINNNGSQSIGSITGVGSTFTKQGSGLLTMNSTSSSFSGAVNINSGTVSVSAIGMANAVGGLGTSGTFAIGASSTTAVLRYTGSGETTDRIVNLSGTSGGATLEANGSGALVLSSNVLATGTGAKTLTLSGTSTAANSIGVIPDAGAGTVVAVSKAGAGLWQLLGANTYSGTTTAGAGVLQFNSVAAGAAAQSLGTGSVVNLGVASTSAGEIDYLGATGTLGKNVFALGTGRNRIRNSGTGTLTLSGTLTKNGTILELAGGTFTVTGQITGTAANSDLFINGATVTLTNTNNNYNGPTYVYGDGTLVLGASGVVPSGSALLLGGTGADTGRGSIVTGTFTDTVASLTTSSLGATVGITVGGTTAGGLTMGSLTLGAGTDTLALSLSGLTLPTYQLLTYTGLRSGTFDTVTGLEGAPNYTLVYGSGSNSSIDLQLKGDQAATFTLTPAAGRVLVGGSTTLSGALVNTSPAGAGTLGVSLTSTGSLTADNFSSSAGSTIAAGGTSTISATLLAGPTAGTQTWSVVNTDSSAITTTSTASGSIDVVNQRTFSISSGTISLGNFLRTGATSGSTTISSSGLNATTANAAIAAFIADETAGLTLSLASGTNVFNGDTALQQATYAVSGSAATAGVISGSFTADVSAELGEISPLTVSLSGTAYDPALASFTSGSTTTSWLVDVGSYTMNSGSYNALFDIYNILTSEFFTADLRLTAVTPIGTPSDSLSINLTPESFGDLQAGLSSQWQATLLSSTLGSFTNTYQLDFVSAKDGQSLGGPQSMTLTVTGVIVVPEPGTIALAGIGLAAAGWARRRRRR